MKLGLRLRFYLFVKYRSKRLSAWAGAKADAIYLAARLKEHSPRRTHDNQ